ncbi:MAG: hypothetical protein JXB62_04560 [Pirellulales bacterium]|nr:hypothetical protein [Pirellulales bacterium]
MRRYIALIAMVCVVLAGSTAFGGWRHVAPVVVPVPTVVHSFHPVGPVYAYPNVVHVPSPVVHVPPPMFHVSPHVGFHVPVPYPTPVVYPHRVPAPVVVYPKVYVRGQPVRNVVRAVLP